MDNKKILSIKNLSKTYVQSHLGKKTITKALVGVNLDIFENEIFALIGLNGSGKTTTIKLLLGLIKPDSGSFRIFQSNEINNDVKEKIGYLPEIPRFHGEFTPKELLKFWGSLSNLSGDYLKKRIEKVLKYTTLYHAKDRKLKGFSRGMLQRLGIAQSLLSEPEFLILDEPMGGLDPRGIIDIRNFMLKLKEQGKTIFFSSHIISEVIKVADRVGILHQGRIVKIVKPHQNLEPDFLSIINLTDEFNN